MPDTMKVVHRLAVAIYVVSIGWFALLFAPSLPDTAGNRGNLRVAAITGA